MDKYFHPTLYWTRDYSSMTRLKLIYVIEEVSDGLFVLLTNKATLDSCHKVDHNTYVYVAPFMASLITTGYTTIGYVAMPGSRCVVLLLAMASFGVRSIISKLVL